MRSKRVLIREDFNVPIVDGKIQSDLRIRAALPGIKKALDSGAQVLLMSHLGRPIEGTYQAEYSLQPVASHLEQLLKAPVKFVSDWYNPDININDKIVLFENVRFLVGETENSSELAKYMASFCDEFIMDAFASAHRAHASTVGVAQYAPKALAGPLVMHEINALNKIMQNPAKPLVAIIGGAKVSSKLKLLNSLSNICDYLLIGGGMANTLLVAAGCEVGKSLMESELVSYAKEILDNAQRKGCMIELPIDVILADGKHKNIIDIKNNDKIMDIGIHTIAKFGSIIQNAKTILWNGPMGVFEDPNFANGTKQIAQDVANSAAFSVAGGGDTVSALEQCRLSEKISYISTAGGAFLEYIESGTLPALEVLTKF